MNIRLMTMDDYDAVYRVWTNTPGMGIRTLDDSPAGIEKFLKRNPTTNFVAEVDGEIVGVTMGGQDGRRGYIYHAAVLMEHRGKGIGRALVNRVCEAMKEEGINKVALVVFTTNEIGNEFWLRQGWEKRDDLNFFTLSLNKQNF